MKIFVPQIFGTIHTAYTLVKTSIAIGTQKCSQLHHQRFNKLSVNDGYHDGAEKK